MLRMSHRPARTTSRTANGPTTATTAAVVPRVDGSSTTHHQRAEARGEQHSHGLADHGQVSNLRRVQVDSHGLPPRQAVRAQDAGEERCQDSHCGSPLLDRDEA